MSLDSVSGAINSSPTPPSAHAATSEQPAIAQVASAAFSASASCSAPSFSCVPLANAKTIYRYLDKLLPQTMDSKEVPLICFDRVSFEDIIRLAVIRFLSIAIQLPEAMFDHKLKAVLNTLNQQYSDQAQWIDDLIKGLNALVTTPELEVARDWIKNLIVIGFSLKNYRMEAIRGEPSVENDRLALGFVMNAICETILLFNSIHALRTEFDDIRKELEKDKKDALFFHALGNLKSPRNGLLMHEMRQMAIACACPLDLSFNPHAKDKKIQKYIDKIEKEIVPQLQAQVKELQQIVDIIYAFGFSHHDKVEQEARQGYLLQCARQTAQAQRDFTYALADMIEKKLKDPDFQKAIKGMSVPEFITGVKDVIENILEKHKKKQLKLGILGGEINGLVQDAVQKLLHDRKEVTAHPFGQAIQALHSQRSIEGKMLVDLLLEVGIYLEHNSDEEEEISALPSHIKKIGDEFVEQEDADLIENHTKFWTGALNHSFGQKVHNAIAHQAEHDHLVNGIFGRIFSMLRHRQNILQLCELLSQSTFPMYRDFSQRVLPKLPPPAQDELPLWLDSVDAEDLQVERNFEKAPLEDKPVESKEEKGEAIPAPAPIPNPFKITHTTSLFLGFRELVTRVRHVAQGCIFPAQTKGNLTLRDIAAGQQIFYWNLLEPLTELMDETKSPPHLVRKFLLLGFICAEQTITAHTNQRQHDLNRMLQQVNKVIRNRWTEHNPRGSLEWRYAHATRTESLAQKIFTSNKAGPFSAKEWLVDLANMQLRLQAPSDTGEHFREALSQYKTEPKIRSASQPVPLPKDIQKVEQNLDQACERLKARKGNGALKDAIRHLQDFKDHIQTMKTHSDQRYMGIYAYMCTLSFQYFAENLGISLVGDQIRGEHDFKEIFQNYEAKLGKKVWDRLQDFNLGKFSEYQVLYFAAAHKKKVGGPEQKWMTALSEFYEYGDGDTFIAEGKQPAKTKYQELVTKLLHMSELAVELSKL